MDEPLNLKGRMMMPCRTCGHILGWHTKDDTPDEKLVELHIRRGCNELHGCTCKEYIINDNLRMLEWLNEKKHRHI